MGKPTIIAVTLRAAGLYLGGRRMSGVGSIMRVGCCFWYGEGGGRGCGCEGEG
jgi:hypothetical protein